MGARQIARLLAVGVVTIGAVVIAAVSIPSAAAAPCPDIEVVFARATGEPAGLGGAGEQFVDSLRSQVGGKSVGAYAVNYPASEDFAQSAPAGARDASAHVQYMAANCPTTRMVLGGYSQGAAVIDLITGVPVLDFAQSPMPPEVADHVAAVAAFGNPSSRFGGGPITASSPLYGSKAVDVCFPGDPICSEGVFDITHALYGITGVVDEAATFAASRV
jgi:cutinase